MEDGEEDLRGGTGVVRGNALIIIVYYLYILLLSYFIINHHLSVPVPPSNCWSKALFSSPCRLLLPSLPPSLPPSCHSYLPLGSRRVGSGEEGREEGEEEAELPEGEARSQEKKQGGNGQPGGREGGREGGGGEIKFQVARRMKEGNGG